MFNLAVYGVVDKVLCQTHTLKAGLAMSLNMNDFVHVDSFYLPCELILPSILPRRSGSTLHSTTKLLSTRVAPSIQECPTLERTMRPPSARPTVPPLIE